MQETTSEADSGLVDRAAEALRELEDALPAEPKENVTSKGPKVPEPSPTKKRRRIVRASKKINRPKKATRRQRRRKVAPRG